MNSPASPPPRPRSRPRSRLRRLVGLTLKLVWAATLTIVLVEIGLRILGVQPVTATMVPRDPNQLSTDPEVAEAQRSGWIPWPTPVQSATKIPEHARGYVEIRRNRCSLREDQEIPFEKPPGTRRIVCVGDSHTDGVCWNPESYPNLLEQRLQADGAAAAVLFPAAGGAAQIEVINVGFGPSSPYQQLWAYKQVHHRFGADVVVVAFYAGNDLVDLLRTDPPVRLDLRQGTPQHVGGPAPAVAVPENRSLIETFKRPFRDHSSIYHALTRIPWLRRQVVQQIGTGDAYRDRIERASLAYAGPVWQGLNQAYYFRHHPEEWDGAVARERYVLEQFLAQTRADHAELRVVVIPTLRQIHPESAAEELDDAARILELLPDDLATDERACDTVVGLARELQIPCLDLRGALRRARREQPDRHLYYRFDHHLNVAGNEVVAEELQKFLVALAAGEAARDSMAWGKDLRKVH